MFLTRYRSAIKRLRFAFKPAIAFEFWSTLIFLIFFAPASGWLLNRLVVASGQYAVSDNDLVVFFLSSQGILFLIFSIGFVLATGTLGMITWSVICITVYKVVKVVRETSLKRRLVEAGFTATEIEMIVSAGTGKQQKTPAEKPIAAKQVPPKVAAYT